MEFEVEKKVDSITNYNQETLDIAYNFTKGLMKEFETFIKAVVLFGSAARKDEKQDDIDIFVIVDDVSIVISLEIAEAYRIIVEKLIASNSRRLHITTLKFTSFWEYVRAGDPVGINILRDGHPIIDSGFFTPLQALLVQGRIRPSPESIWTYFTRAPKTLHNSRWHVMQASVDLYWAVIDSAHAALMKLGEVPPSPAHVSEMLYEKMVKPGHLKSKYVGTMDKFYKLAKQVTHREIQDITGKEYEEYYKEASEFVDVMKEFINKKLH
jgi:predicted nucleotidyltransferase/uncharacterized protein (UPF0332 family)